MQYLDLGLYIKEQREKLGISLNQFAINNGIEPAILSRVETQKQGIKLNFLGKVAQGFGKTAGQFLVDFERYKKNEIIP